MAAKKTATRKVKLAARTAYQKRHEGKIPYFASDTYLLVKVTEEQLAEAVQALKATLEKTLKKGAKITNVKKSGGLKIKFTTPKRLSAEIAPNWTRQYAGKAPFLLDYKVRVLVSDLDKDAEVVEKWRPVLNKLTHAALEAIPLTAG